jgi:hypothetical protein
MSQDNETMEKMAEPAGISLELGDIIQINSPSNEEYHEQTFLIQYIDNHNIHILNISTYQEKVLNIIDNNQLSDESITQINLLNRNDEKGYARQNNLLPNTWIDIHFGGEFPAVVTGKITNLEEDMIEITTYPAINVLYIDFEYKGIPKDIPIDSIVLRERPSSIDENAKMRLSDEECGFPEDQTNESVDATIEFTDTGESIITIPQSAKPNENIREVLQHIYLDAADIFGDDLEEITLEVEVPESQKRYGIDVQINDLMDELLSTIPNTRRTKRVMDNLSLLIQRFKELREKFSKFDDNGNIVDFVSKGTVYKPLVERLQNLNTKIQWIIPVVSNQRKLYGNDEAEDDSENVDLKDVLIQQREVQDNYIKNANIGEGSKYVKSYQSIADTMTPFNEPSEPGVLLQNQEIHDNIDCVVNNLQDFYSSSRKLFINKIKNNRVRYLIQRYNLGITRPDSIALKHGKRVYVRKMMMPSDNVNMNSLLFLPEPVMHASRAELPGTNILMKAQMGQAHLQLFRLLNKSTQVNTHLIENMNQGIVYEDDSEKMASTEQADSKMRFLTGIVNYVIDDDVLETNPQNLYAKYLNNILPETRILIQMMQKYMKHGQLSIVDAVKILEPFFVYPEDISYQQYNNIRYFIKNQLKTYKTELAKKEQETMRFMKNHVDTMKRPHEFKNIIITTFSAKPDYLEVFADAYKINKEKLPEYSNSEIIAKIMAMDDGIMYNTLLSRMVLSLVAPNKLLGDFDQPLVDDMGKIDKIKPTDCARRFLTKKYTSISDMQKDNNNEDVYYDKDYDDTPYPILKKYDEKRKKLLAEDFVDFLAENLIQKHECNPEMAKEMAATLIAGKKRVREGEYAILEITPRLPSEMDKTKLTKKELEAIEIEGNARVKHHYYKRMKEHWVRDESVNEESFMDTQSLFCNIDAKCYKNPASQQCDTMTQASDHFAHSSREKIEKELEKRIIMTTEELEQSLEKTLESNRKQISRNANLRHIQAYKQNLVSYELGKLVTENESILSPYSTLLDSILSQDDFIKKQTDIAWFANEYCREPMVAELNENAHWLYCKETNTKLLPITLKTLAHAFLYGDYKATLDDLCHSYGRLSDDGDSVVDKNSGYVLRKIDFATEEEYDDAGFKITSHSIIEKDLGQKIAETLAKTVRVFDDPVDQMCYNVFMTIATNAGIPPESIEEFVLRGSLELIRNRAVITPEDAYNKKSEEIAKKTNKVPVPWPIYRNQSIISIVSAFVLITAQCMIPSIKTRKTFPGCVKSFSGYPMTGVEDVSGMKYIACILNASKNDEEPWVDIQKLNVAAIATRMKDVIDKFLLKRNDVQELYTKKREYLLLLPDETVPKEHDVAKWTAFLPPIVEINVVTGLRNVSADFKSDLKETLRKGHRDQYADINMLKTKIAAHVYGIIEQINNIVHGKKLILETAAKKPFLQNACCNEYNKSTHPISYFMAENPAIEQYIHVIHDLGKTLENIRELSKAPLYYHPASTWTMYPPMPSGQLETNIYAAFIRYCNYDRPGKPVPEEFKAICGEKPAGYQTHWNIEEKTEFLKKHGKRFDEPALQQLMNRVNHRNIITITQNEYTNPVLKFADFLNTMDIQESDIIQQPLRKLLGEVLGAYKERDMKKEGSSTQIIDLRKYLGKVNSAMLKEIVDFMQGYGNADLREINKIQTFLANIHVWTMDKDVETEQNAIYTICQFIRNSVEAMTKTYPSIILTNPEYNDSQKHWGLSNYHYSDIERIVTSYLASLNKYKQDASLSRLLTEIQRKTVDIFLFLKNIPIETPIHKSETYYFELFDKKTLYLLHVYSYYSVLYEYMKLSMDDDMLQFDMQEIRRERRNREDDDLTTMDIPYDEEQELQEIDVYSGDKEVFQRRVCSMMMDFIGIEQKNKATLDKPYEEISRKIRKSKQDEKKLITDYLEDMEKDERKVEDTLKQLKLGRWNVGIQKGIFMYDKNTYDNERNSALDRLEKDLAYDFIDGEMIEATVEDLDREADEDAEQYDVEGGDIGMFGDDYLDGNYYGEDGDDDFRED